MENSSPTDQKKMSAEGCEVTQQLVAESEPKPEDKVPLLNREDLLAALEKLSEKLDSVESKSKEPMPRVTSAVESLKNSYEEEQESHRRQLQESHVVLNRIAEEQETQLSSSLPSCCLSSRPELDQFVEWSVQNF